MSVLRSGIRARHDVGCEVYKLVNRLLLILWGRERPGNRYDGALVALKTIPGHTTRLSAVWALGAGGKFDEFNKADHRLPRGA